ncbi:MAG: cytochrome c3 family protein [Phycisphaerales bacterium JB039]
MRLLSRPAPGLRPPRRAAALMAVGAAAALPAGAAPQQEEYRVFAANDLGMHCMQQDNSEIHILPPYNTVHAQIIKRGDNPDVILDEPEFTIEYLIPSNTRSADKTNFWTYAEALFGVALAPDIGLTGNGMSGLMTYTGNGDRAATGIPITPIDGIGRENPYPLATIIARKEGREVARTQTVVPVSWEINCNLCHNEAGKTLGQQVLPLHDLKHGTALAGTEPVLCAACHADPALGLPGKPEIPTFSSAMHGAHASRMAPASHLAVDCYACHPGVRTQCQRDVHITRGLDCYDCHGGMEAVASPSRTPWVDEPSCGGCHARPGFEFEEPGKLFRQSRGHGDVTCLSCHGSPHAITPTTTEVDNLQAIVQQGHAGMISECVTCHTVQPTEPFFHSREK